jgi:hypothetical protein
VSGGGEFCSRPVKWITTLEKLPPRGWLRPNALSDDDHLGCQLDTSDGLRLGRQADETLPDAFQVNATYNLHMGTSSDWISVLLRALWFPGLMLIAVLIFTGKGHVKPALTPLDFLSWVFAGLFFGISTTFGWNAFRWPLILLLVGSVIGIVVFGKLAQRNLRDSSNEQVARRRLP